MRTFKTPLSRRFSGAEGLTVPSPIILAHPFTMACWFWNPGSVSTATLMEIGDSGTNQNYYRLGTAVSIGTPVRFSIGSSGGLRSADSAANPRLNSWNHAAGVARSVGASGRGAFLNGVGNFSGSATTEITGQDATTIGASYGTTYPLLPWTGQIVWPTIWNIDLSNDEVFELSRGAHPLTIRPEHIVAFWDWTGADTEFGLRGTYPLVNTGSFPLSGPDFLAKPLLNKRRRFNSVGGGGFKPYWTLRRGQVIGGGTL